MAMSPRPSPLLPLVALALALAASTLEAQSVPPWAPLGFDWGAGALIAIPTEFEREPCGSFFGIDARAGVSFAFSASVAVESSLALGVPRPTPCAADALIPPPDGTVTRSLPRFPVDRPVFASSTHRLVIDAVPGTQLGPRILIGVGRLWSHDAWFVATGLGFRLDATRWSRVIEIERIQMNLPFVVQTDTYVGGARVDRSVSPEIRRRRSIWSVRVRLPLRR